jgi:hypothetical protein
VVQGWSDSRRKGIALDSPDLVRRSGLWAVLNPSM